MQSAGMKAPDRRVVNAVVVGLWLSAGITGSVVFWLVQVLAGGPTIPDFMGEQIAAAGGYPQSLSPLIGWAVHLGVGLSYALLFAVIAVLLRPAGFATRAVLTLVAALVLGSVTALIAPPAISVTISLLGGQGWPAEFFPLNTELGLPFWNHIVFFLLSWVIQAIGPGLRRPPRVTLTAIVGLWLLGGCAGSAGPEDVALEYGRAVYVGDAEAIWRLVSEADRRVKDEAVFRRQQRQLDGFAREVVRKLGGLITATPVRATVKGERASVVLRFRLPDANAPAIRTLVHDWDEERLNRLGDGERRSILERIDALQQEGRLPTIEGDETIELVGEASGWRVFLNWANGVRIHFVAAADAGVPLQVSVVPGAAVLAPGERLRVTVHVRNNARHEVTTRVAHRIEPQDEARYLALLLCPLFVPVTLAPGEAREFVSEYLLLASAPVHADALRVTYEFPPR